jgi:two-component system invasion response regulator UvrY
MKVLFVFGSQLLIEGINSILTKLFKSTTYLHLSSLSELENQLQTAQWDLLIVDADQGSLFTEKVLALVQQKNSVAKTVFVYEALTQKGLIAFRQGLMGAFSKTDSRENIELAFKTVLSGQIYVPQSVILNIICEGHVFTNLEHQVSLLSIKEKELLYFLSKGKRMKEITQLMNLAPSTLSTHKQRIMRKMSLHSTQEFNSFLKAYAETLK